MKVKKLTIRTFRKNFMGQEGIVFLGKDGDIIKMVNDLSSILFEKGIVSTTNLDELWSHVFKLVAPNGRIDLALVLANNNCVDKQKLDRWRDYRCLWISSYLSSYWFGGSK